MLSKVDARGTTAYTYDTLNRLLTVTEPSGKTTAYTYDASGNRLTETDTLGTDITVITYTYDSQNRLTGTVTTLAESTVVTGDEGTAAITTIGAAVITSTVAYTYDNNGNQLSKTTTDYIDGVAQTPVVDQANSYDLFNQLIATITSAGVIVINTYNGDGLRVGKSVNGELTRYLYEYQKVVLEENAAGDQTGRNVYGINLLTRQAKDDTDTPAYTLTYMYNGHADVTALMDTAGNVVATYYYDAFGNILAQTGTVNNSILYTGYQYDKETGLYYLNARMYDPITARFMQEDTYTGEYNDPLSLNLYTYCKNEPLMYSDPTGHKNYKPGESTAEYYSNQAQAKSKAKKQAVEQADFDSGKNISGMPTADYSKKQSITSAAKSTTNGSQTISTEITTGYEAVITTPPGLINIKNTTIGSVSYSSGSSDSSIASLNYTSLYNIANKETKESIKLAVLGASMKTTLDEGNEIGIGPVAFGKTTDMEYGTISKDYFSILTVTGGLGIKTNGDVAFIGKTELNIFGASPSNTTEISANPMELLALGKKYALNPYEELMKKLNSNVGKLAASASIIGGGVAYAISTQGDKVASAIQSAGESLTKTIELPTAFTPFVIIPPDEIMSMINNDKFKTPSNGTASADVNPDGTYNI